MSMTGQLFKMYLGDNIQNWAIPQSNTSINGEVFILMKMWTVWTHMSQRVSQCTAVLDYGEPQILELRKNTLPSRIIPYSIPH